jgi:hypothetical protein
MKRLVLAIILVTTAINFGQDSPAKIGNLSKTYFECWMKALTLNGIKFTEFEHQEDAYHANFLQNPTNSIGVSVREDDKNSTDDLMKMMGYTIYMRNGIKHYFANIESTAMLSLRVPKYKIFFTVASTSKISKDKMEKILDQTKVYEK